MTFVGANLCCTYNTNGRKIDEDKTAITGRIESAILKDDNTFEWAPAEEDYDYIVKTKEGYKLLVFPSDGSKLKKAVVRIYG